MFILNRFHGEIGDVIVGRITEVSQKLWKVDVNGKMDALLLLSAVNLPGGVLVLYRIAHSSPQNREEEPHQMSYKCDLFMLKMISSV